MRKTNTTAALGGASLLAALAALRAAGSANPTSAFFAGRELYWPCVLKLWLGFDCPGCGMTRGVMFALGGDWRGAWALNPGAPLVVVGAALLGAALLFVSLRTRAADGRAFAHSLARLRVYASAYAVVTAAVVLFRWTLAVV